MVRCLTPIRIALSLVLLAVVLAGAALGQGTTSTQTVSDRCTVKGRIFDGETGESMPYTNVFVSGTNIGTMAFTDGFYIIKGLAPGTYTIKASYISYAIGIQTVTLRPGEVLNLDFELEVQAIMAEPFDVAAERALIEVDRTGSSHYITSAQMEAMPLDHVVDMIAQTPGVTMHDNEIHIRGGRADDTMFVVDGMSVNDPLAGGGYGYNIDPSVINEIEVLTGGFNAEYGQAVSGVVKVSTKEGTDRVEGQVSFKRDYVYKKHDTTVEPNYPDLTDYSHPNNVDIIKASMSGPDPISAGLRALGLDLPGTQYILASASLDTRDGYLPIYSRTHKLKSPIYTEDFWAPREENNWNGLLKWTWNFTPHHKLNINLSRNVGIDQGFFLPGEGYPRPYMDNLDDYLTFTTENILTQIYYRQVLNQNSWFELTLGRNFNRLHNNLNGNDDYTTYPPRPPWLSSSYDDYGQSTWHADRWHDHYSESYTLKGAYSFMGAGNNNFKTGFDLSFTEMQLIDLNGDLGDPAPGRLAKTQDIFQADPITGAAYFQDTVNYRGLIVNAGIRADFWAPGKQVEKVMADPDNYLFITDDMAEEYYSNTVAGFGTRWKVRLSPRIGLSFPVTERDKFFFNYGHFSQWARFAYVYPQLEAQTAGDIPLLGNPNLDPKVTVEYETGLQHEFGGLWSMGVTFFNRDIFDYAQSVKLDPITIDAEDTPDTTDTVDEDISPYRYFNGDAARTLGVEISVIKSTTRWLRGSGSLEFQRTTGTSSDANESYLQESSGASYDSTASIGGLTRDPLIWDRPWTVNLNADFSVFDDDRPELFGWTMPPNWSINLLIRAEAGQRYTPRYLDETGSPTSGSRNSALGPWKNSVNIRFNKFWRFHGRQKLTFYLEAQNLFNHRNYRRVNPWTGEGYVVGDYNPDWNDQYEDIPTDSEQYAKSVVDPSYIVNPLLLLWGVSFSW